SKFLTALEYSYFVFPLVFCQHKPALAFRLLGSAERAASWDCIHGRHLDAVAAHVSPSPELSGTRSALNGFANRTFLNSPFGSGMVMIPFVGSTAKVS